MAEIKVDRRRRILSWIVGLVLLTLVLLSVARAKHPNAAAPHRSKATAADAAWDNIPPRLRQYA